MWSQSFYRSLSILRLRNVYQLVVLISLIVFACSDDDDPPGSVIPSDAYTSLGELENAVDTLYVNVARATKWGAFFVNSYAGDDITTNGFAGNWDYLSVDARRVDIENKRIQKFWKDCYGIIKELNTILEKSNGIKEENQQKDWLLGEVYFHRGFMYHHLTRMFGDVPLYLSSTIDPELNSSKVLDIYKQIERDWLMANELLPDKYPGIEAGASRPNNGSTKAFLARLYLDWAGWPVKDASKYAASAAMAKHVIDQKALYGFDLVNDLDDLWTIEHRFNKESIFTIRYCNSCVQGGNRKMGKLGIPGELGGWAETFGEIRFFENFPDNHRKNATYIEDISLDGPYQSDPVGEVLHWTNLSQPNPILAKITGKGDIPRDEFNTDRNDYIMRYAEVLLIFAEASARSGNTSSEPWEALNKIRRRAELLPPDDPAPGVDLISGDLAELAFEEKGWELAGEFLRWYDLIRMERVDKHLNNSYRNATTSKVTDPDHSNYGESVTELIQISGSTGTDNYYAKIPENYRELYPVD